MEKMEFFKKFQPKDIDWEGANDKVRHIQPKWRQQGSSPPTIPNNKHSVAIQKRIMNNEESFNPTIIKQEFKRFMDQGVEMVEKFKRQKLEASAISSSPQILEVPAMTTAPQPLTRGNPTKMKQKGERSRRKNNSKRDTTHGGAMRPGMRRKEEQKPKSQFTPTTTFPSLIADLN